MKLNVKLLSLVAAVAALVTSCVNEGLQEPLDAEILDAVPTLEEQAAAVEASVNDLQNLQTSLKEYDVELDAEIVALLEQHVADLKKGGMSLEEGIFAAFELQKQLGAVVGSALAELDPDTKLMRSFNALEKGVKAWVGENFDALYPAAVAEARVKASVAKFDSKLGSQRLYVDALLSDVEAGLRNDEKPEELKSLAALVSEASAASQKLGDDFAALVAEVEDEYETAVKSVLTDAAEFDAEALQEFNANARVELASVGTNLSDLITRVELCESQLNTILARLGALEGVVGDLEELLGMIQSVTLMTEYSAEEAVAYYNMGHSTTSEGYKVRTPVESIELNYIVRPASAASALTAQSLWNNGLKVLGYYANRIQQSAVGNIETFRITNVTANSTTGVVTVTVDNSLSDDFYYKKTGAKMALSVTTGKTDITSKFVEVVPKDASGTVYLESLTLPVDYVEIDDGQSYQLNAKITPANVTDAGVTWTTSNVDVVAVSGTGKLDAKAVGNVVITVTSNSTDEWGRQLSATCNVKVTPNIKLNAPSYIEEGGTMEIKVESPEYIDPSLITWSVSNWEKENETVATIDQNGVVTAIKNTYNNLDTKKSYDPIYVTCSIYGGQTVIKHELRIVVPQPKKIVISGKGDNENSQTVKIGSEYSLASTIYPDAVQSSEYFGIIYQSSYSAVASIDFNSGLVKTHAPGTARMTITARSANTGRYAYPSGTEWKRYFDIIVEPYWVETLTLPETLTMTPDATTTLSPVFTSDVNGKQPTNTTLTWTSSNPSIVSVNATTGELRALAEGTVMITAKTTSGAAANSAIKTATCVVTVKAPVAEVKPGDYYYSDGTWGSNPRPSGKSVIGVIFSNANAVGADPILMRDYPQCSNGLAVGLDEYTDQDFGSVSNQNGHGYYAGLGYDANSIVSTEKTNGYGNTLAHRDLNASKSDYCKFFNASNGVVATHTAKVSTPSKSSSWYIPSYKEMSLLNDNRTTVNASLSTLGGTPIADPYMYEDSWDDNRRSDWYWTSTIKGDWYQSGGTYDHSKYPFDIYKKGWTTSQQSSAKCKVRVILAF